MTISVVAGRVALALASAVLLAGAGLAARGFGAPTNLAVRLVGGALVSWLVTGAARGLDEGRPRGGYVLAPALVLVGSGLLLLLPPKLLVALVMRLAGEGAPPLAPEAARHVARYLALALGFGLASVAGAALVVRAALGCRQPTPRLVLGGLLALYGGLAFWGAQIQSLTGDEPHYLLAARSLLRDGDLDLTNDYEQRLYREFWPTDRLRVWLGVVPGNELDPHAVRDRHGRLRQVHQLGLSLLLLPGYALAGWPGALLVALVIGVFAAWQVLALCRQFEGAEDHPLTPSLVRRGKELCAPDSPSLPRRGSGGGPAAGLRASDGLAPGWIGGLAVVGGPLLAFAASLHTEPTALLGVCYLARQVVGAEPTTRRRLGAGVVAGVLVWLHFKYLPLVLVLLAYLALDDLRARRAAGWLPWLGLAAGLATQAALFQHLYGSASPTAPQTLGGGKFPGPFSGSLLLGLPGLLVDQQNGLLWAWPLLLLAAPGIALTRRDSRYQRLLVVLAVHWVWIGGYAIWESGFAPAGRQMLPVVGLCGPFIAAGARWRPGLVPALAWAQVTMALAATWLPRLRYPLLRDNLAWAVLPGVVHPPALATLWPLVRSGPAAVAVAWVLVGALAAWGVLVARCSENATSSDG